jgi:HK97 family phage major capsid protein
MIKTAMQRHHAAYLAKLAALGVCVGVFETRDDPSIKSVGEALDKIATAFDEYKKTNDARIEAIKAGKSTADFEAKLAKIDEHIGTLEDVKSRLEKAETKLARPGAQGGSRDERSSPEAEAYKTAFLSWVRNPGDPERRTALQQRAKDLRRVEAKAFGDDDGFETRAAQTVTSTGAAGGFALPEVIERQIARLSLDIGPIRQIATVRFCTISLVVCE